MRKALLLPAIVASLCTLGLGYESSAAVKLDPNALQDLPCPAEACPARTVGTIEEPLEAALVSGFVRIKGFAFDGNLVSNVDLFIDGTDEVNRVTQPGGANINLPRPDLLQAFPQYAYTLGKNPGFLMSFRAANYSNGTHTLYIRITDVTGCCYFLAPRTVRVNNARNQPPFGEMNLPEPDQPISNTGVIHVTGWALDDRRIDHVEIFVDGLQERQAVLGISRPDIAAAFPGVTDALLSGWIMNLDSTRLTNGVHTVSALAVDDQGQRGLLGVARVQIFNNAPNLPPFGELEYPLLNATWFGNCVTQTGGPSGGDIIDARFVQFVRGWALDTSVVMERGGVSWLQLELDGVIIKDTRQDCAREPELNNQLYDCYGYYRPDIEILYPGFQQCPNCGWEFVLDVGFLITQRGFREGAHILQVKAGDKEDQLTLLKELPIYFECATGALDPPPIGFVDDPSNYKFINGVYPVLGWAIDLDSVVRVRILIDGFVQIDAVRGVDFAEYGLPSPDVAIAYPNYPNRGNARFRFWLDTTKLSNSEHDLIIEVLDGRGNRRSAGTRRFLVDNNTLVR